jgi:hypothetical protein
MTVKIDLDYWVELPEPENFDGLEYHDPFALQKRLSKHGKIEGDCSVYFKRKQMSDWDITAVSVPDIKIGNREDE